MNMHLPHINTLNYQIEKFNKHWKLKWLFLEVKKYKILMFFSYLYYIKLYYIVITAYKYKSKN